MDRPILVKNLNQHDSLKSTSNMRIIENPTVHNAIIMGSGTGAGMATKVMADAGPKIAVVEAGSFFSRPNPD